MRRSDPGARLEDIVEAIDGTRSALAGVGFETFARSWTLKRAAERGLEIVSEASRYILPEMKALHPEGP